MPVDTLIERRGMLADFGYPVGYTDLAGAGSEVSIQAIFDTEELLSLGAIRDEISTTELIVKIVVEDVPIIDEGDLFDLTSVPNTGGNDFVVVDHKPLASDGAFVRVVLHRIGAVIIGGPPGDVTPPL